MSGDTMKRKKVRKLDIDYIKATRRISRQEEINAHGHPVQNRFMVHKSKKIYDRNKMKGAVINES